ncbi:hypothetical protein PLICRDRAFT_594395 [Plicaturopsis crispa FD-325 SS-3]|nr:hypothetical protein PLICRDRAFT_594395 [Plicaturopsis crispa FD-325 SS-3]
MTSRARGSAVRLRMYGPVSRFDELLLPLHAALQAVASGLLLTFRRTIEKAQKHPSKFQENIFMPVATLPIELWMMIIGHLYNSPETLVDCGNVCRNWLPITRSLLFSEGNKFGRYTVTKPNHTMFVALLASPLCTLPTFLRHLRFHCPESLEHVFSELHSPRVQPSNGNHTQTPTFEALQCLELRQRHAFFTLSPEAWSVLTSFAPNMRELRILIGDYRPEIPIDRIFHFISSFPRLEVLDLSFSHWNGFPGQGFGLGNLKMSTLHVPSALHTLRIFPADIHTVKIIDWMLSSTTAPPLRDLDLTVGNNASSHEANEQVASTVRSLIREVGGSLEHLNLVARSGKYILFQDLDLSQNTHLRSLGLLYFSEKKDDLGYTQNILSSITSPLEKLSLGILSMPSDSTELARFTERLRAVAALLTRPQFAGLKDILFRAGDHPTGKIVRECFAESSSRGILRVMR